MKRKFQSSGTSFFMYIINAIIYYVTVVKINRGICSAYFFAAFSSWRRE